MNQPGVSPLGPIILGAAKGALLEDAARDLEGFSEEILTPGHSPSWGSPQVPDGLALCVGCWRLITARQLGGERCPGNRASGGPMIAAIYARKSTGQEEGRDTTAKVQ